MSKMSCVCDDGEPVDLVSSYLKGRIKKMQKHADGEVDDIADCMTKLRAKCNHSLAWGAGVPMYISFYGWGNDFERSVFLRCLKHSLRPRLVHSAFMDNGGFEGIAFNFAMMSFAEIESLCDKFKLSIGVHDLESYMSTQMVSCIERIQKGSRVYGNWKCKKTSSIRDCFEVHRRRRIVEEARLAVARETGLEFTTGNMLYVHHMRRNLEIDMTNVQAVMRGVRIHLTQVISSNAHLQQYTSELPTSDASTHIEASLELQYQSMINIEGMLTSVLPSSSEIEMIVVDLT